MKFNRTDMTENNDKSFDDIFYPLTEMFEGVNESNYLQYAQIAEFVLSNSKSGPVISKFLKSYEESAPLLYKMLGLEY